ncbi:MAG: endolytic transglycosylase MltG [Clostridia bacterium]|nr:endolytic transglycosylase MltG [Clostridia bacterium]
MADDLNKNNDRRRAVRRPGMGRQSNPFVDRTRIVDRSAEEAKLRAEEEARRRIEDDTEIDRVDAFGETYPGRKMTADTRPGRGSASTAGGNNSAAAPGRNRVKAPVKKERRPLFTRKKQSAIKQRKVTQEEYKFHKKMKKRRRRVALVILLIVLMIGITIAAGYATYTFVIDHFDNKVDDDSIIIDVKTEQKFRVEKGESTKSLSQRLYDAGLIEDTRIYRFLSKFYGYDGTYNAGTYTLSAGMAYEEIMYILSGTPETVRVTFPEGFTTEQMAVRLENNNVCTAEEFLKAVDNADVSSYEFLKNADLATGRDHRLDGYLFPDTYEFDVLAKPEDVVYKMLNRFNEIFKPAYYDQLAETGLTIDQVVILASIVEKEARLDSDRAPIAGVFYNRYTRGTEDLQLFQSDATVKYAYKRAMGKELDVPLNEVLDVDDPYNTYVYPGFTPGPICSPGEMSLIGALFPSNHDYFYFVAKRDGSGGNVYSRTYEEHVQAIKDLDNYTPPEEHWEEED